MSDAELDGPPSESGAATPSGPKRRATPKRRHTVGKVLLSTLVVLALATGLGVVYLYRHLNGNLEVLDPTDQLSDRPSKLVDGPKGPLNILVMGSDTREGAGNNIDGLTGDGERSDTTILLHLSADRERAYGVSIPRDLLVDRPECRTEDGDSIPGGTQQMWNAAFALGGPACTIQQFEQLTDIRLDHFVVVDFEGFRGMVDAIGGVEVCIANGIRDRHTGIDWPAGNRNIQGIEALQFLRTRHGVGDGGDLGRISNQQQYMSKLARKLVSEDVLSNPATLYKLASTALKNVDPSQSLTNPMTLVQIALAVKNVPFEEIVFVQYPTRTDPADPNRVVPDRDAADLLWAALEANQPLQLTGDLSGGNGVIEADAPEGGVEEQPVEPVDPVEPTEQASEQPDPQESAVALPSTIAGQTAAQNTCSNGNLR